MERIDSVMESSGFVIFKLVLSFFQFVLAKMFEKASIAFLSLMEGLTMKSTAEEQIATFDQLSTHWWEPTGPMILLHKLNKLRVPLVVEGLIKVGKLDRKQRYTTDSLKGLTILDVGCGGGIYSEALAKLHANVVGIDPARHLIEVAKAHAEKQPDIKERCHYFEQSLDAHWQGAVGKYDVVVLSETIEHVVDQSTLLKQVAAVLKPGGSVFISTWNKTNWSWLLAVVVLENIMKRLPKGSHDYEKFISPEETEAILEGYGCHTIEQRPFYLKFWESEWVWVPFNTLTYALHAVKQ
ncbi:ubiquinone biosynthesis O-methyltransferase-like [Anopheles maculipalpis]|uniref:ubiquinone biosynthesis O-methyltransferase-like n=1 Tax=Anopheles maculipalpis TaxID=1496333 RepID=UPI0021590BAA|nr:ubiquinone biosynthesis O-methyltransferase-like [Anopheles maculipalpis]